MTNGFNPTTPQQKAVKNLLEAYQTFDMDNVRPLVSKDFKFQTFPQIAQHPDEESEAHFDRYGKLLSQLTKHVLTYHEVIEAPGKIVLHMTADLVTVDGTELDYDTLSIFTLVEEDGQLKISNFRDFCDPAKRHRLHGWALDALAQMAT